MNKFLVLACGLLLMTGCAKYASNPLFPDPSLAAGGGAKITFTDLPSSCTIEVYTLPGDRVISIVESDGDGQAVWDLKNEAGEPVGAGLYDYVINSSEGKKNGILVIKK